MKFNTTESRPAVNKPEPHSEPDLQLTLPLSPDETPVKSGPQTNTNTGGHLPNLGTPPSESLPPEPSTPSEDPHPEDNRQELPAVLKHPDLDRATETKRAALHVAEALATSPDEAQAQRGANLLTCADQIRENERGELKPVAMCKHRACPVCQQAKQRVFYARLQSALGYLPPLLDEAHDSIPLRQRAQALKVTLNMGEACHIHELKERIKELHKLFATFLNRKDIAADLLGYFRATEVTQSLSSETAKANPHIHGFLLLRGDADINSIITFIKGAWPKRVSHFHKSQGRKISTVKSAPSVKPLRAQTKHDLLGWSGYILKGGTYDYVGDEIKRAELHATSPDFWRGYDQALSHQTLISKGGAVGTAMSQAEADYQAQKLTANTPLPRDHGSTVTKPTDFIFLRSVSGYARRSVIELIHRSQMTVTEYLKLPNVTGMKRCDDEDLWNEARGIALGFSGLSSFTLAMLSLSSDKRGVISSLIRLNSKHNTRTSSHWSEPKERPSKSPEDDPHWRPRQKPPEPPPEPSSQPPKTKP